MGGIEKTVSAPSFKIEKFVFNPFCLLLIINVLLSTLLTISHRFCFDFVVQGMEPSASCVLSVLSLNYTPRRIKPTDLIFGILLLINSKCFAIFIMVSFPKNYLCVSKFPHGFFFLVLISNLLILIRKFVFWLENFNLYATDFLVFGKA